MRTLVLLVIFVVGLLAALAWQGRMHHLRSVTALPGWTDAITPDSTVRRGTAILPDGLPVAGLRLSWTARLPDSGGWQWDVRLHGNDVDASARVSVPFWPAPLRARITDGHMPVAALAPGVIGPTGEISGANGAVDLGGTADAPVATGEITAQAVGISIAGTDLGDGPLRATLAEDGSWTAELALPDGAAPVEAEAEGTIDSDIVTYVVRIEDTGALPSELVAIFDRFGRPEGSGWVIEGSQATR